MKTKILTQKDAHSPVYLFLKISVLLTGFLFFLDEGYYNFEWMKNWGNWIVFLIYSLVIFSSITIVFYFFRTWFNIKNSKLIGLTLGAFVGLLLLFTVIFA